MRFKIGCPLTVGTQAPFGILEKGAFMAKTKLSSYYTMDGRGGLTASNVLVHAARHPELTLNKVLLWEPFQSPRNLQTRATKADIF